MIKEQIQQLETIIDKEIDGYKNIEKLYADKKELLVHGKASELFDVDAKIQNLYKNISNLSDARKNEEGKKITWKDGVQAVWTLIKYRFSD